MIYLTQLFSILIKTSIAASFVAVGILVARLLLKRFPKVFSYTLWSLLLFRLLCPLSLPIRLNLKELFTSKLTPAGDQMLNTLQSSNITSALTNYGSTSVVNHSSNVIPISNNVTLSKEAWYHFNLLELLSSIWVIGIIILLTYSIYTYIKIKRKIRTATLIRDNLYESDQIGTAFVCGFIRPRIYLPVNLQNQNLHYVLTHERVHLQRKDYLIKPLSYLLLILHWFNPLMWLSFALMCRDMEMSCDEKVIKLFGYQIQKDYSYSLLSFSVRRNGLFLFCPLAFGESSIKTRIKNVIRYRKPAIGTILLAILIIVTSAILLLTNSDSNTQKSSNPITADDGSIKNTDTSLSDQGKNKESLALEGKTQKENNEILDLTANVLNENGTYSETTASEIEANLDKIMSSPKESSNPQDYINAHWKEYENILKTGTEGLAYISSQYESNNMNGLRGQIITSLYKDLLTSTYIIPQDRISAQQWYDRMRIYRITTLPDFAYDGTDPIEKLVYDTLIKEYGNNKTGFTIVAPRIFGSYDEGNYRKIITTSFIASFKISESKVTMNSASVLPIALTYQKDSNGKYVLVKKEVSEDGSHFAPSIKNFCKLPVSNKEIKGLSNKILNHYGKYQDIIDLLTENLKHHLKKYNLSGISYYDSDGSVIFMQ